jgi:hypothetical protein
LDLGAEVILTFGAEFREHRQEPDRPPFVIYLMDDDAGPNPGPAIL